MLVRGSLTLTTSRFTASPLKPRVITQTEAVVVSQEETQFFDLGLDNSEIEFKEDISAARKCGFCMG